MKPRALIIALTLYLASGNAFAANLEEELKKCAATSDSSARLACFDALDKADGVDTTDVSSPAAMPMEKEETVTAKEVEVESAVSQPSETEPAVQDFGVEQRKAMENAPESMESAIVAVDRGKYTKPVVTLENGQVWQQTDGGRMKLKVGQTALINRGAFSSFFIQNKSGGNRVRVKRIK